MRNINYIIIFSLLALSCSKEKYTSYTTKLYNKSTHIIKIEPYIKGILNTPYVTVLKPDSIIQIASGGQRGIGVGKSGFFSNQINADSLIVTFDNLYSIVHYLVEPSNKSPRYYLYSNFRNLINMESYAFREISESSNTQSEYYDYTFSEQDYLDAK